MNSKRHTERLAAYSNIAVDYGRMFINELQTKPLDRKLYDLFADKVIDKGKVLEIGCGPGEISNYLFVKGLNITGIDISPEMIKVAKKYNDRMDFQIGNVFNLTFANDSISGIVAPYLIVNFDYIEVKDAFIEIIRVLRNNGTLLVSFHIGRDKTKTYRDFFHKGKPLTFTFYKVDTIKELLKKVGFIITEVVIKEPYEGEQTTRAYIYAEKSGKN